MGLRTPLALTVLALASLVRAQGAGLELPLVFVENAGQRPADVAFEARVPGLTAGVTRDGLVLELASAPGEASVPLYLRFQGTRAGARVTGLEPTRARVNYLGGADPLRWHANLATFARVRVEGLYEGCDLEVYDGGGRVEYDLLLAAGLPVAGLEFAVEGATHLQLADDGDLIVHAGPHRFVLRAPVASQERPDGSALTPRSSYELRGGDRVGFTVTDHDRTLPLRIDPVLVYHTHVGGAHADEATDVAVDEAGNVYVTGWTLSGDFPLTGQGVDRKRRHREAVVFKLGADGASLDYATYLGGRDDDEGLGITVDEYGRALIVGTTESPDFPVSTRSHAQTKQGGRDGFVVCLSKDGSRQEWSTFLGGESDDRIEDVTLGPNGEVYFTGTTASVDFPTTFQARQRELAGSGDAFVGQLDARGEVLAWCTLLGGSREETARALALDEVGNVFVAGTSASNDFPVTRGALDERCGGVDGFVAQVGRAGESLGYATFLGGGAPDEITGLALDRRGRVFVSGWTLSNDFPGGPTTGRRLGRDGFVARLSSSGNDLEALHFFRGRGHDEALAVTLDSEGLLWVGGSTASGDFGVSPDAVSRALAGPTDGFLASFDRETFALRHSSFLGGRGREAVTGLARGPLGSLLVCGWADGVDPKVRGPLGGRGVGPTDAFVARFQPGPKSPSVGLDSSRAGASSGR